MAPRDFTVYASLLDTRYLLANPIWSFLSQNTPFLTRRLSHRPSHDPSHHLFTSRTAEQEAQSQPLLFYILLALKKLNVLHPGPDAHNADSTLFPQTAEMSPILAVMPFAMQ